MRKTFRYWLRCSVAMSSSTALIGGSLLYGSGWGLWLGLLTGVVGTAGAVWLLGRPASTRHLLNEPPAEATTRPVAGLTPASLAEAV